MKITTVLCLILFPVTFSLAQNTQQSDYYKPKIKPANKRERVGRYDIHLGLKAGINRGSVLINRPANVQEFAPQTSFSALAFGSIASLGSPVALQIEIGYANKRSGWLVAYQDTITEQIFDLRYLTVPVGIKFTLGKRTNPNKTHLYCLVGGEFNFLLNGILRLNTEAHNYESVFDESNRISPWEGGAIVGFGGSFPLIRGISLLVEGRGGMGLTNFNRGVILHDYKLRNIYAQFSTGLSIHL